MEVTTANFESIWPELESALLDADVVAFDTELSGLVESRETTIDYWDTVAERVDKLRRSSRAFGLLQLGVCCFKYTNTSDKRYVARPFTLFAYPNTAAKSVFTDDRPVTFQPSSFSFLANNSFDFNKWVRGGIPYLSLDAEETARAKWWKERNLYEVVARHETPAPAAGANGLADTLPTQPSASSTSTFTSIRPQIPNADLPLDSANLLFLNPILARVHHWSSITPTPPIDPPQIIPDPPDPSSPFLFIPCPNPYHRRLVHQEVRNRFDGRLKTAGTGKGVTVSRPAEEGEQGSAAKEEADKRKEEYIQGLKGDVEKDVYAAVGLRRVLDVLARRRGVITGHSPVLLDGSSSSSSSTSHPTRSTNSDNLVLVGHNCILDCCHVVGKLWRDKSVDLPGWKREVRDALGDVVDTKHLAASHPRLSKILKGAGSALAELYEAVHRKGEFTAIGVGSPKEGFTFPPGFEKYASIAVAHEAGYDAYMTGVVYIKFAEYMAHMHDTQGNGHGYSSTSTSGGHRVVPGPRTDVMAPYVNRLHLMRSDLGYVDLSVGATDPSRPHILHLSHLPTAWRTQEVESFLVSHGGTSCKVERWLRDDACLARVDVAVVEEVLRKATGNKRGVEVVTWDEYEAARREAANAPVATAPIAASVPVAPTLAAPQVTAALAPVAGTKRPRDAGSDEEDGRSAKRRKDRCALM